MNPDKAVLSIRLLLKSSLIKIHNVCFYEKSILEYILFFVFVFVALRPMSTAMVIAGRSVHLTTLFPGQA